MIPLYSCTQVLTGVKVNADEHRIVKKKGHNLLSLKKQVYPVVLILMWIPHLDFPPHIWKSRDVMGWGGQGIEMEEKRGEGREPTKCHINFGGAIFSVCLPWLIHNGGKKPSYSLLSFLLATKDKKFSTSKFRNECKSAACSKSFPRQINGYK